MSAKRPIKQENGRSAQMSDADTGVAGLFAQRTTVDAGSTVQVPAGYSASVVGPMVVDGILAVDGRFMVS